jgi:hypothetical protein
VGVSATGQRHDLVITAVALLGVHWPGVSTLDDFTEFLAEGPKIEKTEAPEVVLATIRQRATLRSPRRSTRTWLAGGSMDAHRVRRDRELPEAYAFDVGPVDPGACASMTTGQPYLKVTDEAKGTAVPRRFHGQRLRCDLSATGSRWSSRTFR